jgi:CheY-like chemotaxis protein
MMKVLMVDDNEVFIDLLKDILESAGNYSAIIAGNGDEVYKAFLKFKPDVILTDIEMPIKNGIEMLKDIRTQNPGIKTIYMSSDMERYKQLLRDEKTKYNANVIDKPLCFSKVLGILNEYRNEGI